MFHECIPKYHTPTPTHTPAPLLTCSSNWQEKASEVMRTFWKVHIEANSWERSRVLGLGLLLLVGLIFIEDNIGAQRD